MILRRYSCSICVSSSSIDYITDYLAIPNIFTIFAPLEPVKPLHNAQIRGSFFYPQIHTVFLRSSYHIQRKYYELLWSFPIERHRLHSVFCKNRDYNRKNLYLCILLIVIFCMKPFRNVVLCRISIAFQLMFVSLPWNGWN